MCVENDRWTYGRAGEILQRDILGGDPKGVPVGGSVKIQPTRKQTDNLPAWRVLEMDALHGKPRGILGIEQDRTEVSVLAIENLTTAKLVPPPLAVTVESTSSVNLDILSTPLPEHDGVLERMVEGIILPVLGVVGELDLSVKTDMDVVQEGQVQRLANDILLALGEQQGATMHSLFKTLEELIRDIVGVVLGGSDLDYSPAEFSGLVRMLCAKLLDGPGDAGGDLPVGEDAGGSTGQES